MVEDMLRVEAITVPLAETSSSATRGGTRHCIKIKAPT